MAPISDVVAELMAMLDGFQEEAKGLSGTIERLTNWFDLEPKRLITESLDAVLSKVRRDAPKEPFKPRLVLMSPEGRVRILSAGHAVPEGYLVLNIFQLSRFLKSQVAKGNWMPAVGFIRANREIRGIPWYPTTRPRESKPAVSEQPGERWNLSDFLPAPPPYPPLPRGLFKR